MENDKCIRLFNSYAREKLSEHPKMLERCHDPSLESYGMIACLKQVENDFIKGRQGIKASPIFFLNKEIVEYSECIRGQSFADGVKNDIKYFRR